MKKLICACAVLLLLFSALPCQAADWNFYGSARVYTFYVAANNAGASASNYYEALQTNARVGANVKVSDTLAGRFEYGSSSGNVTVRHLYGQWNFGAGTLLVGQTDTPLNFSISKQVFNNDHNLNAYGHVDGKRRPMIQLSFGNFKIAAIQNEITSGNLALNTAVYNFEANTPKVEASYQWNFDQGYVVAAGGYQKFEATQIAAPNYHYKPDAYILALGGKYTMGQFYLGGDVWLGSNISAYGYSTAVYGWSMPFAGNEFDNDAIGGLVVAGYTLNDSVSFEAGYGYIQADIDTSLLVKDKAMAYYLQSTITLAPGVSIVPEIGVINNKYNYLGTPETRSTYAGAKWQIDF